MMKTCGVADCGLSGNPRDGTLAESVGGDFNFSIARLKSGYLSEESDMARKRLTLAAALLAAALAGEAGDLLGTLGLGHCSTC